MTSIDTPTQDAPLHDAPPSLAYDPRVETGYLDPERRLPLVVRAKKPGLSLVAWGRENRSLLEERLVESGGILFRGFPVESVEEFERFIAAVAGGALEYKERSSPRHRVEGNVYTSTDHPPSQPIFLHNENSYQQAWPMKIFFYCVEPAAEGGATPIADTRRIYRRLDPELRRRFLEHGWAYVRNFGDGFGLHWHTVFQTTDREAVEGYCRDKGIEVEWRSGERLKTRAVRPAAVRHPRSGEPVWFNHATFFHVSTLEPAIRDALLAELPEEDLPANTYYGDGGRIEPEVLERLRAAYQAETVRFPWRRHDVLMLDNMLVAHGREPFAGSRKVVVGMAEPRDWTQVQPPEAA